LEVKKLLKQENGSTVVDVAIWTFAILVIFSFVYEYLRVNVICFNLKDTFENAVKNVLSENYDEVYAGFRESTAIGGQFEGGPEGAADEESPEWINLVDYGDVEQEMENLLSVDSREKGTDLYSIKNIKIIVQNSNESRNHKYEVNGSMKIIVPIKLVGVTVDANVPVVVKFFYNEMY